MPRVTHVARVTHVSRLVGGILIVAVQHAAEVAIELHRGPRIVRVAAPDQLRGGFPEGAVLLCDRRRVPDTVALLERERREGAVVLAPDLSEVRRGRPT